MVRQLQASRIPIEKLEVNPAKQQTITGKLSAFLASDRNLKESAQRAFVSYIKSVHLMKNKNIFNVRSVDLTKFAESLGLVNTPRVRFLERQGKKEAKLDGENCKVTKSKDSDSNIDFDKDDPSVNVKFQDSVEGDDDDDLFTVKRTDHAIDQNEDQFVGIDKKKEKVLTKAQVVKKMMKKNIK